MLTADEPPVPRYAGVGVQGVLLVIRPANGALYFVDSPNSAYWSQQGAISLTSAPP